MILQPLLAKVTHRARPMPDPAPVTSTVLLVQSICSVIRLFCYINSHTWWRRLQTHMCHVRVNLSAPMRSIKCLHTLDNIS